MPYKTRDAWSRATREYVKEITPTICKQTKQQYVYWLEKAGETLGFPNPTVVSLVKMREYEFGSEMCESSKAVRSSVVRTFLRWCGNKDAMRWKLSHQIRPKEDRMFLNENQVENIRKIAHSLGVEHELLFTLGVDNGLRAVDMRRLTVDDVNRLLAFGKSRIIGKGRNGGKPGLLKLNKVSMPAIVEYLKHRKQLVNGSNIGEFWITSGRFGPTPIRYDQQRKLAVEISNATGLKIRTHDQRASFGHRLHMKGIPIETIAKLLRHDSINTSFKSYIGIMDEELGEALEKLCPPETSQIEVSSK
jgi:integrase